ncbi:hypothetical protein [Pontibacter liquoris]|uniref:hypothetical protein n=1 Tax=Pontibacter liquoris TaxID=2905677 RepID=UPI001FA6EC4E|nr:hypothetical protein [Pontibacter liquoris]
MHKLLQVVAVLLALAAPQLAQAQEAPSVPAAHEDPYCNLLALAGELPELALLTYTTPGQPDTKAYDAEKHKSVDKSYTVTSADQLMIDNKFGNVQVNTWNKNEMQVKVNVTARAGTDAKAQEILDNIKIIELRENNLVSFKTEMSPMKITGNTKKSFEINYTVYMPVNNPLTVSNTYGDVYVADLKGKAAITVKYGALKTDRLSSSGNTVKLAYGSGNCAFINGCNLQVSYSDFNLGAVNDLQGSSKFSDFRLGDLGQVLNLDVKYGTLKVTNVSRNIRNISLESGFSPIALNFEDNTSFNFNVNVQFADFEVDKSLVNITSLQKDYTSAEYKGNFGASSAKGTVTVTSKYGDVKFTK